MPIELPLQVIHDRPIVSFTYTHNGRSVTARTWLDTGGGTVLLGRGLVQALGLAPTGEETLEEGQTLTPVEAPVIVAGGQTLTLNECPVVGLERDEIDPATPGVSAFLPATFLRQFTAIFDYPGRVLRLVQPEATGTLPSGIAAPVHPGSGFMRTELDVAGERLGFLVDTGASYSMISEAVWRRWHDEHPNWPTTSGAHGYAQMGLSQESSSRMIRVPSMALGPATLNGVGFVTRPEGTFESYMSAMMTAPIVGALAGNVLRHFAVTLNYDDERLALAPNWADCGQDLRTLGLCLQREDGRYTVLIVSEAAREARGMVQPGDEVVRAGGRRLAGLNLTEAVDALRGEPGERLDLELLRGNESMRLSLRVVPVLE